MAGAHLDDHELAELAAPRLVVKIHPVGEHPLEAARLQMHHEAVQEARVDGERAQRHEAARHHGARCQPEPHEHAAFGGHALQPAAGEREERCAAETAPRALRLVHRALDEDGGGQEGHDVPEGSGQRDDQRQPEKAAVGAEQAIEVRKPAKDVHAETACLRKTARLPAWKSLA
jgi:hypothetical protein